MKRLQSESHHQCNNFGVHPTYDNHNYDIDWRRQTQQQYTNSSLLSPPSYGNQNERNHINHIHYNSISGSTSSSTSSSNSKRIRYTPKPRQTCGMTLQWICDKCGSTLDDKSCDHEERSLCYVVS